MLAYAVVLKGEYANVASACLSSKHFLVCNGGYSSFKFSWLRPRDGSSAGLFFEATISIQGVNLARAHIFQNAFIKTRAVTSSVVPRIKADAAAVLSMKIRVGPCGAM